MGILSCSGVVVWCGLSSASLAGLWGGCCIHQPWGFLSLYFQVPVITLGPTMRLQAYFPQQNPLEPMGEMGAHPCPAGFVNNPAPFGVQQIPPSPAARFLEGWRAAGCVPRCAGRGGGTRAERAGAIGRTGDLARLSIPAPSPSPSASFFGSPDTNAAGVGDLWTAALQPGHPS